MKIIRQGHEFEVDENDLSGDFGFWSRFASGAWEPEVLDQTSQLLADGGTYVDIGAWIGPTLLWASVHADRCIGYEPDPTAFTILERNAPFAELHHVAIGPTTGFTTITTKGDSMSRIGEGDYRVRSLTLADAVAGVTDISLVKIDIEGAEAQVFPQASEALRDLACPVLLSLHAWAPFEIPAGWRHEEIALFELLLWPL